MANHKSALKRHRQSLKARVRNRAAKTRVKNVVKAVRLAVESNDKGQALQALQNAASVMDKIAGKKILHWRSAARRVSRLAQAVNKMA
jgi:small subunit ribosomal protein S20